MAPEKRERRSTEFFETDAADATSGASSTLKPRFDFALGSGTKLSAFPTWVSGNRKKEGELLELALEPLHRALYGRPGKTGERRAALGDFCGFPEDQKAIMKSKVTVLKKDQLKDLAQALGSGILVSVSVGDLAENVLKFLQAPSIPAGKATAKPATVATPRPKAKDTKTEAGSAASPPAKTQEEGPARKKARAEAPPPMAPKKPLAAASGTTSKGGAKGPTEDAVRVEVYRRVLAMSPNERNTLSLKALRQSVAGHFKTEDEAIKVFGTAIKETAAECVHALKAAEERSQHVAVALASNEEGAKSPEPLQAASGPSGASELSPSVTVGSPAHSPKKSDAAEVAAV